MTTINFRSRFIEGSALAGFASSYTDRLEAEAAAKRVARVLAVANDIEVRLPADHSGRRGGVAISETHR
jgi:hypothetical protein